MAQNLAAGGLDIDIERLTAAFSPGTVLTRAHFAKFLLETKQIKSMNEAFEHYLNADGPYYVPREYISPENAIKLIKQAGGIPVLAHPLVYHLPEEELDTLIARLKDAGLEGLEVFYSSNTGFDEGIVQGGTFEDIRIAHAEKISEMDLDGYAIGGLAVGESHEEMYRILDEVVPHLPLEKPTYLMGVGTPANILEAVDRGVDFFDCVYPSRNGRHGHAYTNFGKINLLNARFETDGKPIEEGCQCPACKHYSRAYIRHLLKAKEMLGLRLVVLHNLYFYNTMMEEIRAAIRDNRYKEYKAEKLAGFERGV